MNTRKSIAISFFLIALVMGVVFYSYLNFPVGLEGYFTRSYYAQFAALAIAIELIIASYYLFRGNNKANFYLALFGFTAVLDILFHISGFLTSNVPIYGMIMFGICAIISFYISFSNSFNLGKISLWGALLSFVMGNAIEWFFNFS
ncbi:hypothetical protein FEE95_21395 [Maribacter algarum]|uniref:Uncharacterized protein n=1 Tax=Maribacter algarum (ex Zhang et al. 2020) TaxID=2578118 RepID=A0A5S3PDI9_9FLAO|nr:hypothetical protein [Maribacter algarum]TMM51974.1 hypothetical protein FEE95_21395 [Maribacter algarum]